MVFPQISDFPRASIGSSADDGLPFALLTRDRTDEAALIRQAERWGSRLLVPEVWRQILPQAGILISSSISGGTLRDRFLEAAAACPRRCWLLLEPLAMEFPLPCMSGIGKEITITNYRQQFYSEDLQCMYTHFIRDGQGFMVLWDTAETLLKKLELARDCGFQGYVCPPAAEKIFCGL